MLKKLYLIDINANRRFLLEKTRHVIGGFMKLPEPEGVPGMSQSNSVRIELKITNLRQDILHSFLGLAALALMREEGVNRLDASLAISLQAKERLTALDWWAEGRL